MTIFFPALCVIILKELKNLQVEKSKFVEIKPMKGFALFCSIMPVIVKEKQSLPPANVFFNLYIF